ncbi:MAG: hypothetical protein COV35_09360 [Alphaproteobacteria bacterium CG11_big_fil_rev_8_21_14_0_20_39_49]|nr:MAG: hypothetical protein COV35_09360 [Alphaproteobacteria bacterium CG11_big_fil_rev_8_21_14_0_20_39_49]
MRRIINSHKDISFIARSPENENGTSVERENTISDKNSVFELSNKKKKEIRDTGEPIRNAQRGGYNIEVGEVGRFFGDNREKAQSDLKTLEEETKDKSPEEKNDAVLKFIREKGESLKQEINDEKQEYLKENESELPMFGGAGEASPQDEQSLGETEAILARIRQVNRQAKLDHERKRDVAALENSILIGAAAGTVTATVKAPFEMLIGGLEEIQREEGIDLRVLTGILSGVASVAAAPSNIINFFALRNERKIAERINDPDYLALLARDEKAFFKGSTPSVFTRKSDIDLSEKNTLYVDPDRDGEPGAGSTIGETGNFVGGGRGRTSDDHGGFFNFIDNHAQEVMRNNSLNSIQVSDREVNTPTPNQTDKDNPQGLGY